MAPETRPVALGAILSERRERITVSPDGLYPLAGVYGFGRGILLREAVRGADISASHLYRIAADQVIYSRLKAFEGAFALVPAVAHGRYVSNEFPTFDVDREQALPEFVALVLSTEESWHDLAQRITGVGARRERLKVEEFLGYEIRLPALLEQKQIAAAVAHCYALAAACNGQATAARSIAVAAYADSRNRRRHREVRLGEVAEVDLDRVAVVPSHTYAMTGVKIAGGGLFRRDRISGSSTNYTKLHRLRAGQLVYRKLTAWEGPITTVGPEFGGTFVSPEFPTLAIDERAVSLEFMRFLCQQPSLHQAMRERSAGTAERRSRLKPADLLEIEIELPPMAEQEHIAAASCVAGALYAEETAAQKLAIAVRDRIFERLGS